MIFKGDIISGCEISDNKIQMPIDRKSLKKFKDTHCKPGTEFEMSLQGPCYIGVPCKLVSLSRIDGSPIFNAKLGGRSLSDYMDDVHHITMQKLDVELSETVEITLANIRIVSDIETIIFAETEKKPTNVIHKFNLYKGFEL